MKMKEEFINKQIRNYLLKYNIGNLEISKGGYFEDFLNLLITYYCKTEELKQEVKE